MDEAGVLKGYADTIGKIIQGEIPPFTADESSQKPWAKSLL